MDLSDDRVVDILYGAYKTRIDLDAIHYAIVTLRNRYSASGSTSADETGRAHKVRESFPAWFEKEYGCADDQKDCDLCCAPDYVEYDEN